MCRVVFVGMLRSKSQMIVESQSPSLVPVFLLLIRFGVGAEVVRCVLSERVKGVEYLITNTKDFLRQCTQPIRITCRCK